MSISVNGQSQVPPGFRFHPTEEELLQYYLRKKVAADKIDLDVIQDVDLNKLEPSDNSSRIGMRKTLVFYKGRARNGQKSDWIMHEYRLDDNNSSSVTTSCDNKHTEYVSENQFSDLRDSKPVCIDDVLQEEGWVICRVFKKKNHCHRASAGRRMLNTIDVSPYDCDDEENVEKMLLPYPFNPRNPAVRCPMIT
ncbi:NAC domain-containing protein 43-like [Henckelia pumila]|uniref:NAC domain-containing protein 43-like n=1 Tax=Henckelia pumila TaxID=405737 RepID=UPI003C6E698F